MSAEATPGTSVLWSLGEPAHWAHVASSTPTLPDLEVSTVACKSEGKGSERWIRKGEKPSQVEGGRQD